MAIRILLTVTVALALSACSGSTSLSGTVSYTLTTSDAVEVRDLERAAKVLARHRDLTPTELAAVTAELTRIFETMVTVELQSMQRAERQLAKVERRKVRVITREDARQRLLQRLGNDLALPVLRNESRSTVVFGRIDQNGVSVSNEAWTTDRPVTDLPAGSRISPSKGSDAALLPASPLP